MKPQLFLALVLASGLVTSLQAQSVSARFRIYLTETDSGAGTVTFRSARFGVHPDALFDYDGTGRTGPAIHQSVTRGYSDHWFESESDSAYELDDFVKCAFATEIRLNNNRDPLLNPQADGQRVNIHQFRYTTQIDTFKMIWCKNDGLHNGSLRPQVFTRFQLLSEPAGQFPRKRSIRTIRTRLTRRRT